MSHPENVSGAERPALRTLGLALAAALAFFGPAALAAQQPVPQPADTTPPAPTDTFPRGLPIPNAPDSVPGPGPAGAMLRSIILPGWGQADFHAYFRGAVYYAGWAGTWFMNFKNAAKLDEIRQMRAIRRSMVLDSLQAVAAADTTGALAQELADPFQRDQLIGRDSVENDMRLVENSRKQQRQDWIALTIFWTLASGVDAFVTAHLADFPAIITTEPGRRGGVALRVEVPLGHP